MTPREILRPAAALLGAGALLLLGTPAAAAADVTVSQTEGLVSGQTVTVTGTGFEESAGIYVAVCVDNGPGQTPTPCLGGVDTAGTSGGSVWISSNPPSYGVGLAKPYGPGGTFEVVLPVVAQDSVSGVDCRAVTCAVTVRYDHTRVDDRSGDRIFPLVFAPEGATPAPAEPAPADPAAGESAEPEPQMTALAVEPNEGGAPDDATTQTAEAGTEAQADDPWFPIGPMLVLAAAALVGWVLIARRRARADTSTDAGPDAPSRTEQ